MFSYRYDGKRKSQTTNQSTAIPGASSHLVLTSTPAQDLSKHQVLGLSRLNVPSESEISAAESGRYKNVHIHL